MTKRKKSSPKIPDLKMLRLKDGDVLLVKEDLIPESTSEEEADARAKLVEKLARISNARVLVIFVEKLSDIRFLSEKVMNNAGWYKKDEDD
ncbi:MAG: hypothetical protein ACYSW6_07375 [Planctomycetota bacterium]|jgi:hypothetical protein